MEKQHIHTVELIGISGAEPDRHGLHALSGCHVAAASRRYWAIARNLGLEAIPITPVSEMLDQVEDALEHGNVAVLASGDPLFFGIGKTIIERFGPDCVNIHPALSSMQHACARFKIPWDDMEFLSLHGRAMEDVAGTVLRNRKTLIFTDHRNGPDAIARLLVLRLSCCRGAECPEITVHVAENLGLPEERLVSGTPEEIASCSFAPLNIMMVIVGNATEGQSSEAQRPLLGLTEDEIAHWRGLITKDEIRAVALHRLRLPERGCLWDVGAGSGSVSIEAAGLSKRLCIYSIEKDERQQLNIIKNIRKFGYWNINLIKGEAPAILLSLPVPNRIFIGGSGGKINEIIEICAERLVRGGRMVLNAVQSETAQLAPEAMKQAGLTVFETRLWFERTDTKGTTRKFNPITVITGMK